MFSILYCVHCSESTKQLDAKTTSVSLQMKVSEYCKACVHSHERERLVYFCSTQCLINYVQKHPDRLLKAEKHLVDNERTWQSGYIDPIYGDPTENSLIPFNNSMEKP